MFARGAAKALHAVIASLLSCADQNLSGSRKVRYLQPHHPVRADYIYEGIERS